MNSVIKCVAIDDEPLALQVISKFCQRMGGIELSTFSDSAAGLEAIRCTKPHIAFLDIEMENITGLDIARQLPEETCFIFTTAYLNYVLEGFELDAVDYLHKPFAYSRFQTAVAKAIRRLRLDEPNDDNRCILVKQEYNNVSIPLSDILYIEAMMGYVKIYRENGDCTTSRVLLKHIGNLLPEQEFIRIHRSFIVQKSKIKSFNRREVELINRKLLPIGRLYSNEIASLLLSKP